MLEVEKPPCRQEPAKSQWPYGNTASQSQDKQPTEIDPYTLADLFHSYRQLMVYQPGLLEMLQQVRKRKRNLRPVYHYSKTSCTGYIITWPDTVIPWVITQCSLVELCCQDIAALGQCHTECTMWLETAWGVGCIKHITGLQGHPGWSVKLMLYYAKSHHYTMVLWLWDCHSYQTSSSEWLLVVLLTPSFVPDTKFCCFRWPKCRHCSRLQSCGCWQ